MTNATDEGRSKGGSNRWKRHCTGCEAPLLPGEECTFCVACDGLGIENVRADRFSDDAEPRTDGGRVNVEDLNECWCCGGLTDAPSLCGPCSDAGCNRFTDECESDHIPVERLGDGR